jgi:uncharacterized protein with HEPN domain
MQKQHPEIAWREIAGCRNILVHNYLGGINMNRVWKVIENDLPVLKEQVLNLLGDFR